MTKLMEIQEALNVRKVKNKLTYNFIMLLKSLMEKRIEEQD